MRGSVASKEAPRVYTDAEILEIMQRMADQHGHGRPLSTNRWNKLGLRPTVVTICMRFGSWRNAWGQAGFEATPLIQRRFTVPEAQELAIKEITETYRRERRFIYPNHWDSQRHALTSTSITKVFSSWENAWLAAGITPDQTKPTTISREQILQALRDAYAEHGGALTSQEWMEAGLSPSVYTITRHFVTWPDAWEAVGVAYNPYDRRIERTHRRNVEALRAAYETHRYPISMRLWDELGYKPLAISLAHSFGSWNKAWEAIGVSLLNPTRVEILGYLQAAYRENGGIFTAHEWVESKRFPSLNAITGQFGSLDNAWRDLLGLPDTQILRPRRPSELRSNIEKFDLERIKPFVKSGRELQILQMYLENRTLADIGSQFGLTRERIRQIVRRAYVNAKFGRSANERTDIIIRIRFLENGDASNLTDVERKALNLILSSRKMTMTSLSRSLGLSPYKAKRLAESIYSKMNGETVARGASAEEVWSELCRCYEERGRRPVSKTTWNTAHGGLSGYRVEKILGMPWPEIWPLVAERVSA